MLIFGEKGIAALLVFLEFPHPTEKKIVLKGEEAYAELWCVAAKEGKKKSAEMDCQILEDLQKYLWLGAPGTEGAGAEFLKAMSAKEGAAKKAKVGAAPSSSSATGSASSAKAKSTKACGKQAAMRYFS